MAAYILTVPDGDLVPREVEVSVAVYRLFDDSRLQAERERYERRAHLDSRSLDSSLQYELVTQPLEELYEHMELMQAIWRGVASLSPVQRRRVLRHFVDGYTYAEIAAMEGRNKTTVMRSTKAALKKIQKFFAA